MKFQRVVTGEFICSLLSTHGKYPIFPVAKTLKISLQIFISVSILEECVSPENNSIFLGKVHLIRKGGVHVRTVCNYQEPCCSAICHLNVEVWEQDK